MPRIATTLALALCLLGCSSEPPDEPIELVTAPAGHCFVYYWEVVLIADPTVGVVARYTRENPGQSVPVVWPLGYVGRRDGSEIVVYDGEGKERARTGMTAFLMANDLRDAPGAIRATCLNVSIEPLGSSHDGQPVVRSGNLGRVTFADAE